MTASPGRMRTSEKISSETSHRTSAPCRSRRVTYVRTAWRYCANLSNFRPGALSVSHAVFASYEQ